MKTIFKCEFVIEQHRKKKTRSEILKMGKDLNLNAMFIKRTLNRYAESCFECFGLLCVVCFGERGMCYPCNIY